MDDIPDDGLDLSEDVLAPFVAKTFAEMGDPQAPGAVTLQMHLERLASIVSVTGVLAGHARLSCSRCLEPVPLELSNRFRFYLRQPPVIEVGSPSEVGLTEDQLDFSFMQDSTVDVPVLVQEQLTLELPAQPLCRPDCKGICQGCGAELNHETCTCPQETVDPRFAVLKNLKMPSRP